MSHWSTTIIDNNDLADLSDFVDDTIKPIPKKRPSSIRNKARGKPSIYDPIEYDQDENENEYQIVPEGRGDILYNDFRPGHENEHPSAPAGRGVSLNNGFRQPVHEYQQNVLAGRGLSINGFRRPGGQPLTFLEEDEEKSRSIRQSGGLDYSNDYIEQLFGAPRNESKMSIIKHVTSPASSIVSTPTNSPSKSSIRNGKTAVDMPFIKLQASPESSARSTPTKSSKATSNDTSNSTYTLPPTVLKPTPQIAVPSIFDIINSAKTMPHPKRNSTVLTTSNSTNAVPEAKRSSIMQGVVRPPLVPAHSQRLVNIYDNTKREKDKLLDINSPLQFPPLPKNR